ncbi:MAG: LysM peptidoglycan-binding domain-containing protein [Anaerolineae bacterium]|jgi:LysM repeat protein|nr:LysM peptidoglycan-binding domain-containing protein [Anaerolineae bacterium]
MQWKFWLMIAVITLATATAQAQAPAGQCSMFYTVQRGDTLTRIAREYQTTVRDLQTWNGIANVNRIEVGQQLCVGRQVIVDDQAPRTHTVQRGETLGRIARHYGVDLIVLARVNNIANPNRIYAGQVLLIPDVTIQ